MAALPPSPSSRGGQVSTSAPGAGHVKLLRPDGQGIMLRVFNHYAASMPVVEGVPPRMHPSLLPIMLLDMGVAASDVDGVVATGVFGDLRRVEAAMDATSGGGVGRGDAHSDGITFAVFPTLLSECAVRLAARRAGAGAPPTTETEARQAFMKRHVLPLHERVKVGAIARPPTITASPRLDVDHGDAHPPLPSTTASPRSTASSPMPAAPGEGGRWRATSPPAMLTLATDGGGDGSDRAEDNGGGHGSVSPAPQPATMSATAVGGGHHQQPTVSAKTRVSRGAGVGHAGSVTTAGRGAAGRSRSVDPNDRGAWLFQAAARAQSYATSDATFLYRPAAEVFGTTRSARSRSSSVHSDYVLSASMERLAAVPTPAEYERQRAAKLAQLYPVSQPVSLVSKGSQRILARLEATGGLGALAHRATSRTALSSRDDGEFRATSASARRRASDADATAAAANSFMGVAVGEMLYQQALARRARLVEAEEAAEEEARQLRNGRKSTARSDDLVRQRIGREVVAAVVYTVAHREADGMEVGVTSPVASMDGVPTLHGMVPWWLVTLTPFEIAAILYHMGFLTAASSGSGGGDTVTAMPIPSDALCCALARWACKVVSSPPSSPMDGAPAAGEGVQVPCLRPTGAVAGVVVVEEEAVPASLMPTAQLLLAAYIALLSGDHGALPLSPTSPDSPTFPAVKLVALLHALVSGGYDVRVGSLLAVARAVGLVSPLVLVLPQPRARGGEDESRRGDNGAAEDAHDRAHSPPARADLPPVFASALAAHAERLRSLVSPTGSDGLVGTLSEWQAWHESANPIAMEALEGRWVLHLTLLQALRPLYTNRLAYLGTLTRRDTDRVLTLATAALPPASAAAVTALAASRRTPPSRTARAASGAPTSDDEPTFHPMLCRKSLEMVAEREGTMLVAIPVGPGAPTVSVPLSRVPREEVLLQRAAQMAAATAAKRAEAEAAALAECTFTPALNPISTRMHRTTALDQSGRAMPRTNMLYHLAAVKQQALAREAAERRAAAEAAELAECTFAPRVSKVSSDLARRGRSGAPPPRVGTHSTGGSQVGGNVARGHDDEAATFMARVMRDPWTPGGPPTSSTHGNVSPTAVGGGDGKPAHGHSDPGETGCGAEPRGVTQFLNRMQRVAFEREEKKVMEQALMTGTLHWVKPSLLVQHEAWAGKANHLGGDRPMLYPPTSSRGQEAAPAYSSRPLTAPLPTPPRSPRTPPGTSVGSQQRHPHANTPAATTSSKPAATHTSLPLVYVDVAVSASTTERVPLWDSTDCTAAAEEVAAKHRLPHRLAAKLAALLKAQQARAMAGRVAV